MELLIKNGANVNATDNNGSTAFDLAAGRGNTAIYIPNKSVEVI